jgi:hypothetical protein
MAHVVAIGRCERACERGNRSLPLGELGEVLMKDAELKRE